MVGKQYKHKKGTIYTVIMLTNTGSDDPIGHPVNVVYMGQDGKTWSRLLSEWDERFTEVNVERRVAIKAPVRDNNPASVQNMNKIFEDLGGYVK